VLSSCQLLGGGSSLDDALEVVPGDATSVTFVARAANAERLGIEDADVDEYLEKLRDDPFGGTPLSRYLEPMKDAAFNELDVQWWVNATTEDGPHVNVYKVEDVDLDEVVGDLEDAGFESEEKDGRTMLTAGSPTELTDPVTGLIDGQYPPEFGFGVLVDPDEDLVATGAGLDRVVDVLDDDEDSLTDAGTFDDLAEGVDDIEFAYLAEDPPCGGRRSTPEQIEQAGVGELGTPTALGFFVRGDGEDAASSGRLLFDDDDAAESDLDARKGYVEDGRSVISADPVSDLGSAELEQDGSLVTMELDLENPKDGFVMAQQADAYFACAP
jgi:hypothetical protein